MINAVKTVVQENVRNWKRLVRLAQYELKSQNSGTMLGFLWNFLNPVLQIFVYWFVFAIGLNASPPRGGYPYIVWMVVGIIPWFYINAVLMGTSTSIYAYSGVLKRMPFPMSLVPVKTVLANFIGHVWAMLVVFAVILLSGHGISPYVIQLPYFFLCSIAFLTGYGLLVSSITVLFKDFQKILSKSPSLENQKLSSTMSSSSSRTRIIPWTKRCFIDHLHAKKWEFMLKLFRRFCRS